MSIKEQTGDKQATSRRQQDNKKTIRNRHDGIMSETAPIQGNDSAAPVRSGAGDVARESKMAVDTDAREYCNARARGDWFVCGSPKYRAAAGGEK